MAQTSVEDAPTLSLVRTKRMGVIPNMRRTQICSGVAVIVVSAMVLRSKKQLCNISTMQLLLYYGKSLTK
ncbi:hypothetical protein OESDEN_05641 [Oesophagostomum dentatum]|uniref:Uncharacterized protein n=1 Tax=Oesophagostomum dentatum TaxID=61180 RepID=A0A0B1TF19_OESDE|nr:hypothetical protein OESDEN_05641 [Oesophagostomum dentatum]